MNDLLFAPPWWLPVLIGLVGVVLFMTGNSGGKAGVRNAGAGVIGLAIVYVVVAYLVETDKEKVTRQSREVVAAVEKRDWTKLTGMMEPGCTLTTSSATLYADRKTLIDGAKSNADRWAIKSLGVTSLQVKQDPGGIIADLGVFAQGDYTTTSGWQFTWQKFGDEWKLHQIDCVSIGNEKVSDLGRYIGK